MKDGRIFIDTNIFVYAKLKNKHSGAKHRMAVKFLKTIETSVVISTQVLNEFSSILLKYKIENEKIYHNILALAEDCFVAPLTLATVEGAWRIKKKYRFSYWDSLIIASAVENHCSTLYTEDLQHEQIIEKRLKIINPFNSLYHEANNS